MKPTSRKRKVSGVKEEATRPERTCSVDGCASPHHAHGLCGRHNALRLRHGDPLWSKPSKAERFWQRVAIGDPDDCWEWTAGRFDRRGGYGRFMWDGRPLKAHRVALELASGVAPLGDVSHACDNPPCCNPSHLRDATHAANMGEMAQRGRSARGERNAWARLTEDDVREIRRRCANGETQRTVAEDFGVIRQTVQLIVAGKRWGHVA